jgi:NCS1 family nucleobase:cation symporter-1
MSEAKSEMTVNQGNPENFNLTASGEAALAAANFGAASGSGPVRDGDLSIETRGIEPVPATARYGKAAKLGTLWFGVSAAAPSILVGALGPAFGLSFWQTFWVIIAGNVVGSFAQAYLCSWGPSTGLAQLELSTTAFGRAVRLPAILNWISNFGWQGFNSVFGVAAIHALLGVPLWIGVLACFAGQAGLALLGYEAVHQFARITSVVMMAIVLILTVKILGGAGTTAVAATVKGPDLVGTIVLTFMAIASNSFAWAPYASDYSRYLPVDTSKSKVFMWTFFGCVIALVWVELLGLGVAAGINSGGVTGTTTVIEKIMGGSGSVLGLISMAAIYISIVSVSSLDIYTGTLSLQTAGVRLSRPLVVGINAVVAFGICMWFLYGGADLASRAENFLLFIGYWIAPWFGIIVVDWVRRRGNVHAAVLGDTKHLHSGAGAAIALVVGFISALPFSNTTIGYNFVTANPHSPLRFLLGWVSTNVLHGADLGFPVSCVVGIVLYVLLDRTGYLHPRYMNKI